MSGNELWRYIEKEAQDAYDCPKDWKLTMVDLGKRDGNVKVRLEKGKSLASGTIWIDPEVLVP